jgi:hypothetical protein
MVLAINSKEKSRSCLSLRHRGDAVSTASGSDLNSPLNLSTRLEDIAFTAAGVDEFDGMLLVDLLAQPVDVNLDGV